MLYDLLIQLNYSGTLSSPSHAPTIFLSLSRKTSHRNPIPSSGQTQYSYLILDILVDNFHSQSSTRPKLCLLQSGGPHPRATNVYSSALFLLTRSHTRHAGTELPTHFTYISP